MLQALRAISRWPQKGNATDWYSGLRALPEDSKDLPASPGEGIEEIQRQCPLLRFHAGVHCTAVASHKGREMPRRFPCRFCRQPCLFGSSFYEEMLVFEGPLLSWSRCMIFGRILTNSVYTPYSIYFRIVVYRYVRFL